MEEEIPFSEQMATRKIHAVSDALVNAKLAFAMTDNSVWAEGLLVFYEIFKYLEEAMVRLKNTPIGEFRLDGLKRTEAFESDLRHFLGEDWTKDYSPRESVTKYLLHLMELERKDPILLMAYIYHLYMGLLSGGQILSKKRELMGSLRSSPLSRQKGGTEVTDFPGVTIAELKRQIVEVTNGIAQTLDDATRQRLLEESEKVFTLNNTMIKDHTRCWRCVHEEFNDYASNCCCDIIFNFYSLEIN